MGQQDRKLRAERKVGGDQGGVWPNLRPGALPFPSSSSPSRVKSEHLPCELELGWWWGQQFSHPHPPSVTLQVKES